MACSLTNIVRFLSRQTPCTSKYLCKQISPTGFHLINTYGCPSTGYQQCRTKKTFTEYKFNKPVKFDNSGDIVQQEPIEKSTILYKYRDLPELETLPDELKKLLTAEYASSKEVLEHRHMEVQDKMTETLGPDASLEKQIAYLTVKIKNLIQGHPRRRANKFEKVHILERIAKRNKMLGYLRQLDFERYVWIQKELGIRYIPYDPYTYHRPGKKAARKKEVREAMIAEICQKYAACKAQFSKELAELQKEKENIMEEIEKYDLDRKEIADQLLKDLKEKQFDDELAKLSPKFREFEIEKKRKKMEDAYVF